MTTGLKDSLFRARVQPRVISSSELGLLLSDPSSCEAASKTVFADLSLGSWKPRQAASELAMQLGIALPLVEDGTENPQGNPVLLSYSAIIGRGVDAEARGDLAIRVAYQDASAIATAAKLQGRSIVIIAPRYDCPCSSGDHCFVRILVLLLHEDVPVFSLVSDQPSETLPCLHAAFSHSQNLAALLPGLIPEQLFQQTDISPLQKGWPLAAGLHLVSPDQRCDPASVLSTDIDKLTTRLQDFPWLRAYAMHHGNNLFVNSLELSDRAALAHDQGASDLALRLLERAVGCAKTPLERGICQARAQGIRIATHRFEDVAAQPEPARSLPSGLYEFLLQSRGWGLVMTGQTESAERCFTVPLTTLRSKETHNREDLYLLNIYALAQVRQGRHDEALSTEQQITAAHASLADIDYRLCYINNINLARLYRMRGDLEQAWSHYQEAFATSDGTRSPMESLHWNVIQASMGESLGQDENACRRWLRAALHWLVCPAPEALSPRIVQAILGRPLKPEEDLVGSVDEALLGYLKTADFETAVVPRVQFLTIEKANVALPLACGSPGWSVLASTEVSCDVHALTFHRQRLITCVTQRLLAACSALTDLWPSTIVIDSRHGTEVPVNSNQLLLSALEHGICQLAWGDLSLAISPQTAETLLQTTLVSISPAIQTLELYDRPRHAIFKRHFSPKTIGDSDVKILRLIRPSLTTRKLADKLGEPVHITWRKLLQLCRKRFITLSISEEECTAVGINWHTSGN